MPLLRWGLVLIVFLCSLQARADDDWSPALDSDGIKVWTRPVTGHPIRAFKAVTVVKSSLSGLINLIMDTENADKWVYRTMRVEVLQRDDDKQTFVIRVETDFPWPLTNRDTVVAGQISQDERTGIVSVRSHSTPPGQYPEDPDFVRMPDLEGNWTFRPLGQGLVEVTMSGRADPGGHIPAGVVNLLIYETPYRTLRGLRREIGAARYQKSHMPQIREPLQ